MKTATIAAFIGMGSFLIGPAAAGPRVPAGQGTALDRYVAAPDPSYRYELIKTIDGGDVRAFIIALTSQTWLTAKEVDRPLWKHWLTIIVPRQVRGTTGFLMINGGSNRPEGAGAGPPPNPDPMIVQFARGSGTVVADLRMIPNEPLTFVDDRRPRTEDAIIAYTWDKFLRTGDDKWPLRLPMTKAAVRAMDTVTSFCASEPGGKVDVNRFIVAGGSKRGWTTWTTAAVDDRVVGIVPLVIDVLNLTACSDHQFAAYGFWAPAVKDYTEMDLDSWRGTPQRQALLKIEDPYSYRDRYTMPKLEVNATGDQYFLPDNSQFYFADLPGPKYLRYVPNTDHSLRNSDARETVFAFYQAILTGAPLPRLSWTMPQDGSIQVQSTGEAPAQVKLWQATNPDARDFRLESFGAHWTALDLPRSSDGTYVAKAEAPAKGWTAFFVELTYPSKSGPPLKFTTQVRVVPDALPYANKPRPVRRR